MSRACFCEVKRVHSPCIKLILSAPKGTVGVAHCTPASVSQLEVWHSHKRLRISAGSTQEVQLTRYTAACSCYVPSYRGSYAQRLACTVPHRNEWSREHDASLLGPIPHSERHRNLVQASSKRSLFIVFPSVGFSQSTDAELRTAGHANLTVSACTSEAACGADPHRLFCRIRRIIQDVIHGSLLIVGPHGLLMGVCILRFIPPIEVHHLNSNTCHH